MDPQVSESTKEWVLDVFKQLATLAELVIVARYRHAVVMVIMNGQADDTPIEDLPRLAEAAGAAALALYPLPAAAAAAAAAAPGAAT